MSELGISIKTGRILKAVERADDVEDLVLIAQSWNKYYGAISGPVDREAAGISPIMTPNGIPINSRIVRIFHDVLEDTIKAIAVGALLAANPHIARVVGVIPVVLSNAFGILVEVFTPTSTASDKQHAYFVNEIIQTKIFRKYIEFELGNSALMILDKDIPTWQADIEEWYERKESEYFKSLDSTTQDWLIQREANNNYLRAQINGRRGLGTSDYAAVIAERALFNVDNVLMQQKLENSLRTREALIGNMHDHLTRMEHDQIELRMYHQEQIDMNAERALQMSNEAKSIILIDP